MTKRQSARDRIEAERQRVQAGIEEFNIELASMQQRRALLDAQLVGIEAALMALGGPVKRQRLNGAGKPRTTKTADPQLPIGA